MRLAIAICAALLWQAGAVPPHAAAPEAPSRYMRYQRLLVVPANRAGEACAVLDASVFAHEASAAGADLGVFLQTSSGEQAVPLAVSYSEARPTDATSATVHNRSLHDGQITFDLEMPHRPYTTVNLQLAATNFVATAQVWGSDGATGVRSPLGSFVLFDLSGEGLARSTALQMQESAFPELHVELRMRGTKGQPIAGLSSEIVRGADVPASREAQTLYTVVASTRDLVQQGTSTIARIEAQAHVPVERVRFVPVPGYNRSFLRPVSVAADKVADAGERETVSGTIWQVIRPAAAGLPPIDARSLTMDAVIASNMHANAAVTVAVQNGNQPPLPLQAVQLEMRQRQVCFNAIAGGRYLLRYGDEGAATSVYNGDAAAALTAVPLVARMGPEAFNRDYVKRNTALHRERGTPETRWTVLLAGIALLGALASRHTKRQGRHR